MFLNFIDYYNRNIPKNATFFDVGANKGQWFEEILKKYPDCSVYAFEPIPGITPKYLNVLLNNYAIDIYENEKRSFFITKDNVTSSLMELEEKVTEGFTDFVDQRGVLHKRSDFDIENKILVNTRRLDKFIELHDISEIHYLKIDTEGNDLNVFKSLGEKYNIVWGFEIEVWNEELTLFKGSAWRDICVNHIESRGFTMVDHFIHGKGKSTDILFINNRLLK